MHFPTPIRRVLIFLVFTTAASAQTTPALTALNNAFRAAYADAKTRVLAQAGPTLIVNGDNFSLLRQGQRLEASTATPIYDPVKTIAHIPLAIYVTLTPGDGVYFDASTPHGYRCAGKVAAQATWPWAWVSRRSR